MTNKLYKKKLFSKKKIINGWIHIDSISSTKIITSKSFNSLTVDLQHGMLNFETCKDIIQIIAMHSIFPIVRVPSNEIGIINKCLDAGAMGIICPLINNKQDSIKFTNSCYYPLKGIRSFGPTIASIGDKKYFEKSNSEIFTGAMIETKESVVNLNEILENKNLDLVYIGPYDLSISYGVNPNKVFDTKEMINLYLHILKLAKLKKKKVAIHCSGADTASFFLKKGFDMVTVSTDLNLLSKAITEELEKLKL